MSSERTLTVRLRAVVDGYEKALESAGRATDRLAAKGDSITSLGKRAEDTGGRLTRGLTLPLGVAGGAMLLTAGNFEASMREVQALLGASTEEMARLEGQAKRMGAQTQFSASEAADALGQLVKGGFDATQAYEALPGVMQLAAAATIDIASAADIATNVLSAFGLEVQDLATVNDYLAQTANASDTDVRELGEAFKYVGPVARGAGLSLNETMAAMGLLAENGIRASQAGTTLRGAISALLNPTGPAAEVLRRLGVNATTADGQLRPLADIVEQLTDSGASAADIFAIFGNNAAAGMQALVSTGAPALEKFTGLLEDSGGVAQNLADSKMGGLNGSIEQLKGSLETLMITVGDSGVLAFTTDLATGAADLANGMAGLPGPVLGGAVAIGALAAATGPAMWAFGKMTTLYKPVISGLQMMALNAQIARESFVAARASGLGWAGALGSIAGPQIAVVAGLAALAAGAYLLKRHSDEMAKSHQSSSDSALSLAASAGIATRELSALNDETESAVVTTEDWRKENEEAIATILAMDGLEAKQDHLMEIGYSMVLHGVSPEDAVREVERFARETDVRIPAELTVENVGEFDSLLSGISSRTKQFADGWSESLDRGIGRSGVKALDEVSKKAHESFATDNITGWAAALAEAEGQLGSFDGAVNYLADRSINDLGKGMGLSQRSAGDLKGVLEEVTSEASQFTESQKAQAQAILDTAAAMDGGLTPANVRAAAAQAAAGYNAGEFADRAAAAGVESSDLAGEAENLAGEMGAGIEEVDQFGASIEAAGARAAMSSLDLDAAAAAADAYVSAIENSTSIDDRLAAGLGAGSALKALREGMTGQQRLAEAAEETAAKNEKAASSIDRLADAAESADPKLSALGIRMGALSAGADAFRKSMSDASWMDDQATGALDLGEAFRDFGKLARRLPADLDLQGISTGGLKKRQAEAVSGTVALGKATQEYLATLIESGESSAYVQSEAARLRGEYEQQMRQVGLNEEQIARYIRMMGLAPDQVTTAIELSGAEAARFELDAYLQVLNGKIPGSVATSVIASIEAGDISGAAGQLAAWAKTNPVEIDVKPSVDDDGLQSKVNDIRDSLWDLPQDFDPLAAALGGYTDAQHSALDAVMAVGDGIQGYIESLVAAGTPQEEAVAQAKALRDEFAGQLEQYGITGAAAQEYLDLVGLSDWQIESSISLSGDTEAMFRITAYQQFMNEEIPDDVKTDVIAAIDDGRLQDAADILKFWRYVESQKGITIPVKVAPLPQALIDVGGVGAFGAGGYGTGHRVPGQATGGRVTGPGTSTSDSVLRRLSNDEFVVRASAAERIGYGNLEHANATGTLPKQLVPMGNLMPAGGGQSGPLSLDDDSLRRLAAMLPNRGYTIEKVELVSPNPSRAAEDIIGRGHSVAKVLRLVDD